jgi:predicted RNA binding protein YcfA (HicA-like mRNA interferase family)
MERVLTELGFVPVRRKGSHVFYRHADGRTTTVRTTRE